jgi:hypothetical protein
MKIKVFVIASTDNLNCAKVLACEAIQFTTLAFDIALSQPVVIALYCFARGHFRLCKLSALAMTKSYTLLPRLQ